MAKTKNDYPNRYYVSFCKKNFHVTGWYDTHDMTLTDVPDAKDLHPITVEEWKARTAIGHGVKEGKLVRHTQIYKPPITELAKSALSKTRELLLHEYVMHNLPIPQEYVDYQTALKKVINGESDMLPEAPSS